MPLYAEMSLMGSLGSISAGEVIKPFLSLFKTSSSISSGAQVASLFTPSFVIIISLGCAF